MNLKIQFPGSKTMKRRKFLKLSAVMVGGAKVLGDTWASSLAGSKEGSAVAAAPQTAGAVTARDYLKGILYTPEEVRQWLAEKAFPFAKYSSEFGWLLRNASFQDGFAGSTSVYTYGSLDERVTINYKNRPAASTPATASPSAAGERWRDVAKCSPPTCRNPSQFRRRGWSVYRAICDAKEERRVPAEVILNIFDDDHFRISIPGATFACENTSGSSNPRCPTWSSTRRKDVRTPEPLPDTGKFMLCDLTGRLMP